MSKARIVPDVVHHGLYRVRYPDGELSDLMNLTRALQAVRVFAEGGPRHVPARPPVVAPVDALVLTISPVATEGEHRRGEVYDVRVGDRHIVRSHQPFLDAARVLLSEGANPATVMVMRRAGSPVDSLVGRIGVAAKLTVDEGEGGTGTPRFRTWKPFSGWDIFAPSDETDLDVPEQGSGAAQPSAGGPADASEAGP
jgi:hypothetical protein